MLMASLFIWDYTKIGGDKHFFQDPLRELYQLPSDIYEEIIKQPHTIQNDILF